MNTPPKQAMAKALDVLLNKLIADLGFCLSQDDIDRIISRTECDADEFTDMVFHADGMEPHEDLSLRRQVRRMFTDRFGSSIRVKASKDQLSKVNKEKEEFE